MNPDEMLNQNPAAQPTNDPTLAARLQELRDLVENDDDDDFDAVAMLDSVVAHLRQYLVCDEYQYNILALWILSTWCFQEFPTAAYLNIRSPEPQSGKTRCLELLYQLADQPSFLAGASPATVTGKLLEDRSAKECETKEGFIFHNPPYCHMLDDCHHTLSSSERQPLLAMLNSGTRAASRYVLGSTEYCLFSPKAFASNAPLPRSLASRCIPIVLRRKKPSEVAARFHPQAPLSPEVEELVHTLDSLNAAWLAESAAETPDDLPANLTARQQDCAEPLLHIADAIGGPWPARARAAIVAAFQLVEDSESIQLLADIRNSFLLHSDPEHLTTADLLASLVTCENRPWSSWNPTPIKSGRRLGVLLRGFGIRPINLKIERGKVLKGYKFADLQDAWERYRPASPEIQIYAESHQAVDEIAAGSATNNASATPSASSNSLLINDLQGR
jgi:hypothetical protein